MGVAAGGMVLERGLEHRPILPKSLDQLLRVGVGGHAGGHPPLSFEDAFGTGEAVAGGVGGEGAVGGGGGGAGARGGAGRRGGPRGPPWPGGPCWEPPAPPRTPPSPAAWVPAGPRACSVVSS